MTSHSKISLIIAEDHPMMRDGVRNAVKKANITVVGEAENGEETLALCQRHRPDMLLLDLSMPHTDPQEMLFSLPTLVPETKVIVLTAYTDISYIEMAKRANVAGYVFKDEASRQLITAIETVARGDTYFSSHALEILHNHGETSIAPEEELLSDREKDILNLLVYSHSNCEIAAMLYISPNTVKYHLKNIYSKLNFSSRQEAIRWTRQHNLAHVS